MKPEVESLNNCVDELQQAYVQSLELEDAHHGYIESRREQVRPQGGLLMKEKALRETQIRNIHEMGEMRESSRTASRRILCIEVERKS